MKRHVTWHLETSIDNETKILQLDWFTTHTFRCRNTGWISSMAGYTDVEGAPKALVLHDSGWVLLDTLFMIKLSTQGQKAPFNIFPTLFTYKTGMDS